jgi:hypothetical protein
VRMKVFYLHWISESTSEDFKRVNGPVFMGKLDDRLPRGSRNSKQTVLMPSSTTADDLTRLKVLWTDLAGRKQNNQQYNSSCMSFGNSNSGYLFLRTSPIDVMTSAGVTMLRVNPELPGFLPQHAGKVKLLRFAMYGVQ